MKFSVELPDGAIAFLVCIANRPKSLKELYRAKAALEAISTHDLKSVLRAYRKTPVKVTAARLEKTFQKAREAAPKYERRFIVRRVNSGIPNPNAPVSTLLDPSTGSTKHAPDLSMNALDYHFIAGTSDLRWNDFIVHDKKSPRSASLPTPARPADITPQEWADMDLLEARMLPREDLAWLALTRRPPAGLYDEA